MPKLLDLLQLHLQSKIEILRKLIQICTLLKYRNKTEQLHTKLYVESNIFFDTPMYSFQMFRVDVYIKINPTYRESNTFMCEFSNILMLIFALSNINMPDHTITIISLSFVSIL